MGGVVKWNETKNTVEVTPSTPKQEDVPEPTKMTSDGLEAVYSYYLKGYYLELRQFRDEYYLVYDYSISSNLDEIHYFEKSNPSNKITAKIQYENGVIISYEEYENVLLPFFQQYFK